jgi:murein L,D-transpeptidase YcbB/YkuD
MPIIRKKVLFIVLAAAALAVFFLWTTISRNRRATAEKTLLSTIQESLRRRLDKGEIPPEVCIGNDLIQASTLVRSFYQGRQYQPVWSSKGSLLSPVQSLVTSIRAAEAEGLAPGDYHFESILANLKEFARLSGGALRQRTPVLSDLELLLTDAFFVLATHLAQGKVDPDKTETEWEAPCRSLDVMQLLQDSLSSGRVAESLQSLSPQHSYYAGLKQALQRYKELVRKNDWPRISEGRGLRAGDKGKRVEALKKRLLNEGYDLSGTLAATDVFDHNGELAVCRFQEKHGLPQTGVVDEATRKALNTSAEERLRQIEVNLERWRWLPHDLGPRYAVVDAASFELFVVDRFETVLSMKIVVGMLTWQTPVFSSRITDIVINPYWYAPNRVLLKELINYIKADPNYLTNNKMKLMRGWGKEETEVDVKTLDLDNVNAKNLDFYLRQDPGPLNLVGHIKFSMPNKYNVYLHDTPYQSDFGQFTRTFSHGCIRIAKPVDFSLFLLQDPMEWNAEKITECIDREIEQTIPVKNPLAVHVFYGTAWPLEDGSVQFRPDLYENDKLVAEALHRKPSRARVFEILSLNGKAPSTKETNAQGDEKKRDDR